MNYADILKYGLATRAYVDSRDALTLATVQSYTNSEIAKLQDVFDLGDISGAVTIDLSYSAIKFNLTGNATFMFTNPPASGVNRPTTFYCTRTSGSNAVLSFAQSVSWVGSKVAPSILDVQTTVFSVSTINAGTSYFGFANGLVIETTASGQATTWNPSDYAGNPPLVISNENRTIECTANLASGIERMARAFGGKNTGKWQFTIRVDAIYSISASGITRFCVGITDIGQSLMTGVGTSANSFALMFEYLAGSGLSSQTINKRNNSVKTQYSTFATAPIVVNDLITVLYDCDAQKLWFAKNNVIYGGGSPELGTTPAFSIVSGIHYYPAVSFAETTQSNNAGIYRLLSAIESEASVLAFPSFKYVTA